MTTLTAIREGLMNKQTDLIRVAIVDDNKATLNSMQEVLTYYPKTQVVLTAGSGSDFLDVRWTRAGGSSQLCLE